MILDTDAQAVGRASPTSDRSAGAAHRRALSTVMHQTSTVTATSSATLPEVRTPTTAGVDQGAPKVRTTEPSTELETTDDRCLTGTAGVLADRAA
ncbi:MAG: hypothetical protein R2710_12720 [Acidimicrobiales bacterium]